MFGRKTDPHEQIDIDQFVIEEEPILGQPTAADPANFQIDVDEADIIAAEFHDVRNVEAPRAKKKAILLAVVGIFAVGGIVSIFAPESTSAIQTTVAKIIGKTPAQPDIVAEPIVAQAAPSTEGQDSSPAPSAIDLPAALAVQTPAETSPKALDPGATPQPPTGQAIPVAAESTATQSPPQTATPSIPAALAAPPNTTTEVTAAVPAAAVGPTSPTALDDTQEATKPPVAASAHSAPATAPAPVLDAATSPVKPEPAPVASSEPVKTTAPDKAVTAAQSKPVTTEAAKPVAAKATVAKAEPARAVIPAKKAAPRKPDQEDVGEADSSSDEGIKRLVTVSAESMGLVAMQPGSITIERKGGGTNRLTAGDRLDSGEQIIRIDAASSTLVTDRSVIRVTL